MNALEKSFSLVFSFVHLFCCKSLSFISFVTLQARKLELRSAWSFLWSINDLCHTQDFQSNSCQWSLFFILYVNDSIFGGVLSCFLTYRFVMLFSMPIVVDLFSYLMLFINIKWGFTVAWLDKTRVIFVKRIIITIIHLFVLYLMRTSFSDHQFQKIQSIQSLWFVMYLSFLNNSNNHFIAWRSPLQQRGLNQLLFHVLHGTLLRSEIFQYITWSTKISTCYLVFRNTMQQLLRVSCKIRSELVKQHPF